MAIYKLDKSIVITNNFFSSQAIDDAKSLEVMLWDRTILRDKIKKIDNERKRRETETQREAERQKALRRKREKALEKKRYAVTDEKGINKPAYGGNNLHMEDVFHGMIYKRSSDIRLVLGKDFHGNDILTSLKKSQHLLLFGCDQEDINNLLHSFISSILIGTNNFLLYIVENNGASFCVYKDIPGVEYINTITGAHSMIRWVVDDVNKRLATKQELRAVDITKAGFPRIIIVIEELTDLIGKYNSLEKEIEFLAQNGDDAGISMILASHHPSKTEYEDRIKELIPVRACLRVVNSQESIMAIGVSGAEQLQGSTDFWFKGKNMVTPMQIRGPLMSDADISKAIDCALAVYAPIRDDKQLDYALMRNEWSSFYAPIRCDKQLGPEPVTLISGEKENIFKTFLRRIHAFFIKLL